MRPTPFSPAWCRIAITNRDGLLKRSCACIGIMHEEERRLRETTESFDIG